MKYWFESFSSKMSTNLGYMPLSQTTPVGINEKGFVSSNYWMFLLVNYCIEMRGMPWWMVLFNILSKSSKIVHFSQICYTFTSCSGTGYQFDVVVVLIISQLLSKHCNVTLLAPRSWRQVCAIRNLPNCTDLPSWPWSW